MLLTNFDKTHANQAATKATGKNATHRAPILSCSMVTEGSRTSHPVRGEMARTLLEHLGKRGNEALAQRALDHRAQ